MTFEWDGAKNRANAINHGIDFETARRIFDGPVLTRRDQRRDYRDERYVSLGRVEEAVIVVAHTTRGANVRLISTRPASRGEAGLAWLDTIRR